MFSPNPRLQLTSNIPYHAFSHRPQQRFEHPAGNIAQRNAKNEDDGQQRQQYKKDKADRMHQCFQEEKADYAQDDEPYQRREFHTGEEAEHLFKHFWLLSIPCSHAYSSTAYFSPALSRHLSDTPYAWGRGCLSWPCLMPHRSSASLPPACCSHSASPPRSAP